MGTVPAEGRPREAEGGPGNETSPQGRGPWAAGGGGWGGKRRSHKNTDTQRCPAHHRKAPPPALHAMIVRIPPEVAPTRSVGAGDPSPRPGLPLCPSTLGTPASPAFYFFQMWG